MSSKPNKGVLYANKARTHTVRIRQGDATLEEPETPEAKAELKINRLSEIFDALDAIK